MSVATYSKDSQAVTAYSIDWSDFLTGNDTIASSSWTMPSGISQVSAAQTTTATTIRLSGGTPGSTYELINLVTTANGLTEERSFVIDVQEETGQSLVSDTAFGSVYLTPAEFMARKSAFPVPDSAIPTDRTALLSILAAASRWIDSLTNKSYGADVEYDEQHEWSITRRIRVNNPPVMSVSSYEIFVGPNSSGTFQTSNLFINNQEGYVELAALALAESLTPAIASFGIIAPTVRIVYTSSDSIPDHIKLATGYLAAALMQSNSVNASVPSGIKTVRLDGIMSYERFSAVEDAKASVPAIVSLLLQNEAEIVFT